MSSLGAAYQLFVRPCVHSTLWRCDKCESLVSIHSVQPLREATCPICGDESFLECCGAFEEILGLTVADA